jgi:hypothetical protein
MQPKKNLKTQRFYLNRSGLGAHLLALLLPQNVFSTSVHNRF